jgi:hypothetical protein
LPETNAAGPRPDPSEIPRPYRAAITARGGRGQSLITSGWSTWPVYRAFILVTPSPFSDDGQRLLDGRVGGQIRVKSVFVEAPESGFAQTGLRASLAEGYESSLRGKFSEEQAQGFVKAVESMAGADILTAPSIVTAEGRQAQLGLGGGPSISVLPPIALE